MDFSVCLVATELFAWGRYGGFGRCTRSIGAGLAERGVGVSVVVPRGRGQREEEELDGMRVLSFPLYRYPFTASLYRRYESDIYHSEEPSWGSRIAMGAMPGRKHVVTCQNPRTPEDWGRVYRFYPRKRRAFNALYRSALTETMKQMDSIYCQARFIRQKVRAIYNLDEHPGFLPNPVEVPSQRPVKSGEATVCFLGRFDGEKRPELFFELASKFPDVEFVALGRAHSEARDRRLRRAYRGIENLELPGFALGEAKRRVLERSWVLVNTSVSECLPVSFLEAAAHRCAILSFHDPDGFASRFGFHASERELESGLRWLLDEERWRELGERGYAYVSREHEYGRVINLHLAAYEALLEGG
ncbi:MAG: glycosyltransferase family 4 protein [Candidatus Bathyarchaeota archaeon]|nr:MAG: glycosyltransferase family 4 protein [Candidatus Bathyarchaeota archaeon]